MKPITDAELIFENVCKKNGFPMYKRMRGYYEVKFRHSPQVVCCEIEDETNDIILSNQFETVVFKYHDLDCPYDVDLASKLYDMMNDDGWRD